MTLVQVIVDICYCSIDEEHYCSCELIEEYMAIIEEFPGCRNMEQ